MKVVFERIVGIAADEQDIRVGIDLVRAAVMRAETDGRRQVTHGDGEAAVRAAIAPVLQARASGLPEGERTILYRIAEQARVGGDMTSGAIFEAICGYQAIGRSTYHEHLKQIAKVGIVDLMPGSGRGREREVLLRYDPEKVASVCRHLD